MRDVVAVVDAGPHGGSWKAREESDVDAAAVVAVDEHDLLVGPSGHLLEHGGGEQVQHGPSLRLDDTKDVGPDVADHHGRVFHCELVDVLGLQLDPSDPVGATLRDHRDGFGPVAGTTQECTPDLAKLYKLALVLARYAEELEELEIRALSLSEYGSRSSS